MKILKVIHGYPPRYNAGSEVYTKTLCHELDKQGHQIIVFTRHENTYEQEYSMHEEVDRDCPSIKLHLINMAHSRDGYQHLVVDEAFAQLLEQYQPDIIHIGHLNHLSTSMIKEAHKRNFPIVFTLHDFWLMCPRGQFLQAINSKTENLYPACDSQENEKCARACYWRYFSSENDQEDIHYWSNWVKKRMEHIRNMASLVDLFIAPSKYLMNRFINDFSIDPKQIHYLDYGFEKKRLENRRRKKEKDFVFGYIGTHKQAKGIFHLLQAFQKAYEHARLKIWGPPLQPFTKSLQKYIETFDPKTQKRIDWMGDYRNEQIVSDVFNHVDAIVVPSIWGENSPLVIHEALEAKVPVITADFGGMKEYIHHEINGLLFKHRDPSSLALQMQRLVEKPGLGVKLSNQGYLQSNDRHIPGIEEHVVELSKLYEVISDQKRKQNETKTRSLAHYI